MSLQSHIKSCSLCQSKGCFACPEAVALILYEAGAVKLVDKTREVFKPKIRYIRNENFGTN